MDAKSLGCCFLLGIWVGSAGCAPAPAVNQASSACSAQAMEMSFLVKWKGSVPPEYQNLKLNPTSLITKFSGTQKADLERQVLSNHISQYDMAEPEYAIETIEDSRNISSGTADSEVWAPNDIQVPDAWALGGKKGDGVIVAVIDSGADISHPLLQSQIWNNPGETGLDSHGNNKATNGIDDDGNGLIDDAFGWDFVNGVSNLSDDANHGTHVSGIIAGQASASTGFTGVAPNATLMPLKFISGDGNGAVSDAINAIEYASNHGAKVINASWGGSACSSILQQEIQTASINGIVFVNAAGNGNASYIGYNIATEPEYPAVYQAPGKITVASYNIQQALSSFSNFGLLVDLAAPGEVILSTVPPSTGQAEGQLAIKSGTSMATPYVSGVVALLFSVKPSATVLEITSAIDSGAIPENFVLKTGGKLNALNAVKYILSH